MPQCQECSELGTLRITEISGGKPVDRWFCKSHSPASLNELADHWNSLFGWLATYLRANGRMPTLPEISGQSEFAAFVAVPNQSNSEEWIDWLRTETQKRMAVAV